MENSNGGIVMKCENCKGTGFRRYYIEEYQKKGYTKDMEKDPDGYNILKCRICKGTGESDEKPKYYEVVDQNGPRHDSHGVMARVMTFEEAEVLMSVLDRKWDGCKGSFDLHVNLVYERDIGLQKWKRYLCLHEWSKKSKHWASYYPNEPPKFLEKDVFNCLKCGNRRRVKDGKLPAYDGIGYWNEKTQSVVIPKEKVFVKVSEKKRG